LHHSTTSAEAVRAPIQLEFEKFSQPGLYLVFDDGLFLTLTRDFIDGMTRSYLEDPSLLPLSVRTNPDYAPCSICPQKDTALICHAIPTVFPFLDNLDRFLAHDRVLAIFRPEATQASEDEVVLHVSRTSVQRALQHISILSLTHYCEVGLAYSKHFAGIVPLMDPFAIVERVYANIYRDLGGDLPAINALTARMRDQLDDTVRCQMARLRLICRSDAFLNAFVNTHIITQFVSLEKLPAIGVAPTEHSHDKCQGRCRLSQASASNRCRTTS